MVDYKPEHIESILDGDMSKMARKSFGMAEDIAHGLVAPGLAFTGLIDIPKAIAQYTAGCAWCCPKLKGQDGPWITIGGGNSLGLFN